MTRVNQESSPVMLKRRMQEETKMPAAAVCPAVRSLRMATAAMAFMGWTGKGIPKKNPVRMLYIPVNISVVVKDI